MADPVTFTIIATAAAAAIAAGGTAYAGMAQSQQYKYQAKVAKMNEEIAQENSKRALARSAVEQENFDRTNTAAMIGEQEQAQSASGLSLTGRSMVQTRASARKLGRYDALNIIQAGHVEAYNYRTQAANFAAEAGAAKMSAKTSLIGGYIGAAGELAKGAASIGSTKATFAGGAQSTAAQSYQAKPIPKPGIVY